MCTTTCELSYSVDLNKHWSTVTNFRIPPRDSTETLTVEVSVSLVRAP